VFLYLRNTPQAMMGIKGSLQRQVIVCPAIHGRMAVGNAGDPKLPRCGLEQSEENQMEPNPLTPPSMGRSTPTDVGACGSRIIRRCGGLAFIVTSVSWLLVIPGLVACESQYGWCVVMPLSFSVFLPGHALWGILRPAFPGGLGLAGLAVCPFVANSAIGFLLGTLLHKVRQRMKGEPKT
jgi:hypothetical protein